MLALVRLGPGASTAHPTKPTPGRCTRLASRGPPGQSKRPDVLPALVSFMPRCNHPPLRLDRQGAFPAPRLSGNSAYRAQIPSSLAVLARPARATRNPPPASARFGLSAAPDPRPRPRWGRASRPGTASRCRVRRCLALTGGPSPPGPPWPGSPVAVLQRPQARCWIRRRPSLEPQGRRPGPVPRPYTPALG